MTAVMGVDPWRVRPEPDGLIATTDPFDRAHEQRDAVGELLIPAAARTRGGGAKCLVRNAKPRRYPPCYMTSAGVSFETAAEELGERVRWLESQGLLGRQPTMCMVVELACRSMGAATVRARCEADARYANDEDTAAERRYDAEVDAWIAERERAGARAKTATMP